MEAARGKGTVLPLSTLFPAEEAIKASERVHETIIEKRKELDTVHNFAADNTSLINLVQRLPDELHHQIMVPFGSAAFFPGRLVHTNEFTVFLGENYYAERTAKQTIDILTRRGKTLESHADSLKAGIKQLKTQASFFDRTAQEAEEGLVEIREELFDEDSGEAEGLVEIREEISDEDSLEADSMPGKLDAPRPSEEVNGGGGLGVYDDEENAHVWSKLEELEREELERGDDSQDDEDEDSKESEGDEHEDFEELEADEHGDSEEEDKDEFEDNEESEYNQNDESSDNLLGNLITRSQNTDMMKTKASMLNEEDYVSRSILKTTYQSSPKSKQVSFQIPEQEGGSRVVGPVSKSLKPPVQMPKSDAGSQLSRTKPDTDTLKAFSGTIVERTDNLPLKSEKQTTSQLSNSQSSRPVSRFKMQRMAQGLK